MIQWNLENIKNILGIRNDIDNSNNINEEYQEHKV